MKNPFQFLGGFVSGLKEADLIQQKMLRQRDELLRSGNLGYGQSILDPRFAKDVAAKGITPSETPAKAAGAYASRALIDAANDGTRTYWWRWNHPLAIAQRVVETGVKTIESPTGRAITGLSIAVPAIAAAGTYDITNPEESFRPKGFAQSYSAVGAEDRRKTAQPAQELFERFFLGRTGEPLKYETAKQDIPELTKERLANYNRFLYQDKGLLGLGIVKGTMENIQGVPELRVLGYPVNLPMAGGFALGTLGAKVGAMSAAKGTPRQRAVRGALGGLAGSLGGVLTGNVVNQIIAQGNRPNLPTTSEYGVSTGRI